MVLLLVMFVFRWVSRGVGVEEMMITEDRSIKSQVGEWSVMGGNLNKVDGESL